MSTGIKHLKLDTVTSSVATFNNLNTTNENFSVLRTNNILSIPPEANLVLQDTVTVTTNSVDTPKIYANTIASRSGNIRVQDEFSVDKIVFDTSLGTLTSTGLITNSFDSTCSIMATCDLVAPLSTVITSLPTYTLYEDNYATVTFTMKTISSGQLTGGGIVGGSNIMVWGIDTLTIAATGLYVITGQASSMIDSGLSSVAGIGLQKNSVDYVIEQLTHPAAVVYADPVIQFTFCDKLNIGDEFTFHTFGTPAAYTQATVIFTFFKVQ